MVIWIGRLSAANKNKQEVSAVEVLFILIVIYAWGKNPIFTAVGVTHMQFARRSFGPEDDLNAVNKLDRGGGNRNPQTSGFLNNCTVC